MKQKESQSVLKPSRILWGLIIASLTLFVIHLTLKYVSIVIFDEKHGFLFELANRFDMNDESSVPQWFSHMLFLAIGLGALFAGKMQANKAVRNVWYAIGILGVLLSIDDAATLHEFALQTIHNTFFLDTSPSFFINAWWLLLPIVLIPAGLIAFFSWKYLPRRIVLILIGGGLVFVLGKILMDSVANDVTDFFIDQGVVQGIEKLFQYSGLSIVLYAVLSYLDTNHTASIKSAIAQLKPSDK